MSYARYARPSQRCCQQSIPSAGASTSLVLDAELVAVDRENNNRLKAFQELSTRARGAITAAEVSLEPSALCAPIAMGTIAQA